MSDSAKLCVTICTLRAFWARFVPGRAAQQRQRGAASSGIVAAGRGRAVRTLVAAVPRRETSGLKVFFHGKSA